MLRYLDNVQWKFESHYVTDCVTPKQLPVFYLGRSLPSLFAQQKVIHLASAEIKRSIVNDVSQATSKLRLAPYFSSIRTVNTTTTPLLSPTI